MDRLLPSPLRECCTARLRLHEDGSVLAAVEAGPDPLTSTVRNCRQFEGADALGRAVLWIGAQCELWALAGTLGLASEAPG